MSAHAASSRPVIYALGGNALIAIAKLCATLYTGSGAMLASSVHSFADCGNQLLLIWGIRRAKAPPSPDYPQGYGQAIYYWSFIAALMLFSLGGLFAIYEGMHKLSEPEEIEAPWIAIAALLFGMLLQSALLWCCWNDIRKGQGGQALWRWVRHTPRRAQVLLVGEHIAALLGLLLALLSIVLSLLTENPIFDAIGGIVIGLLLIGVAIFVGVEIKGLLVGRAVPPEIRDALRRQLDADPAVVRVFNLLALPMGAGLMVAVKADIRAESPTELVEEINRLEADIRAAFPQVRWLFVAPDKAD
ncbi:cation diffusion facilitator family transporter [Chitinimonas sp. BJYL2]|uniref:cation diffusion facilitator family transporter n=1 Tax=Chitinimonas sp. BJYL2 TaxID=2976696 RepID=UPI0022B32E97|nr:cation diffusion facilitator family transporter [Chitinimonas sp. BJYL2]